MIDCDHNAPFINNPGNAAMTVGACSKCGKEIHATYGQLLRLAAIASDFADDMQNTISGTDARQNPLQRCRRPALALRPATARYAVHR